ncbi:transposase family protein [Streptomyces rubiginosohelvolus]|uniref:transposase family protein n=1 Tax=Streptomyces rubiginosohelvolus TaxID=67362 RepID=UPI003F4DCE9B
MLVVTGEGDRRCMFRPSRHAMAALVYLREHAILAKIAVGFGISESTAHAAVIHLLKAHQIGEWLLQVLRLAASPEGREARPNTSAPVAAQSAATGAELAA